MPFEMKAVTQQFLYADRRYVYYADGFHIWAPGGFYRPMEDAEVELHIRRSHPSVNLSPTDVARSVAEAKAAVLVPSYGVTLPHFISEVQNMPEASQLIACRNGVLDPESGCLYEHTPALLTFNALPFDYDPNAPRPAEWHKFLNAIFPDDDEARECLQRMFGYILTLDTSLQKIFQIVGPTRAGKGTIAEVLRGSITRLSQDLSART
jgi:hypothetical protein